MAIIAPFLIGIAIFIGNWSSCSASRSASRHHPPSREKIKEIDAEHVFFLQPDGMVCRNGIDDFLEYDYVGAPWPHLPDGLIQGNGGMSLRKRSFVLKCLQSYHKHKNDTEDVYFANCAKDLGHVPDLKVNQESGMEGIWSENSLTVHKSWFQGKLTLGRDKRTAYKDICQGFSDIATIPFYESKCHILDYNDQTPPPSVVRREITLEQTGRTKYDICIVGAGLSGAVIAERYATQFKKNVYVMEKRNHIGGNCYDYIDEDTRIRVNKYGAHLFHTKYKRVWDYIQQFSDWTPYQHKVLAFVDGKHVPVPVNIDTVNALFGLNIQNSDEMDQWLKNEQVHFDNPPQNSEEMSLSRVGKRLYEKMFKPYTIKQWAKTPAQLGPEVMARIPVRNNHDGRYFSDKWQALPTNGYTAIFEKMFNNPLITVETNVDYFEIIDTLDCGRTYYTGPVDTYFADLGLPKLEYRSLEFVREVHETKDYYQPNSVINHPSETVPYTRIVEYKHFLNQQSDKTVIFKEFSQDSGEPYYPVPNPVNKALFEKYKAMSDKEKDVIFVGRLANYKYFNMDQTILNALDLFAKDTLKLPYKLYSSEEKQCFNLALKRVGRSRYMASKPIQKSRFDSEPLQRRYILD
ncbi:UDP-galactopyranose mutase-like [Amphiura filiformis]|uniref:UDP-galactopyranose mutase-like n=1 Tax=Amphiura filiformis TaxID=82378 RepID=UPI003B228868